MFTLFLRFYTGQTVTIAIRVRLMVRNMLLVNFSKLLIRDQARCINILQFLDFSILIGKHVEREGTPLKLQATNFSLGNSTEIFAEITAAEAAHPGSLRAIREYFPNTYKVYLDMMKARRKR